MEDWISEDVERLKRYLVEKRMTYAQIAMAMGRTRNAVIGKAHRLGLFIACRKKPEHATIKRRAGAMVASEVSLPLAPSREARVADGSRLPQSQCRWPFGDPRDKDFHFCERPCSWHSSYCEEHYRVAYQGNVSAGRRERDG